MHSIVLFQNGRAVELFKTTPHPPLPTSLFPPTLFQNGRAVELFKRTKSQQDPENTALDTIRRRHKRGNGVICVVELPPNAPGIKTTQNKDGFDVGKLTASIVGWFTRTFSQSDVGLNE
jgi:hypothetical protein